MKHKKIDPRVIEAEALDKKYAEAFEFDRKQFERWLREKFVLMCKRTDFPKLGYIIHRLNELGIPCILYGRSFHADNCLWVDESRAQEAWDILSEKFGKKRLDDIRDDDPRFERYVAERPELLEEGWDANQQNRECKP